MRRPPSGDGVCVGGTPAMCVSGGWTPSGTAGRARSCDSSSGACSMDVAAIPPALGVPVISPRAAAPRSGVAAGGVKPGGCRASPSSARSVELGVGSCPGKRGSRSGVCGRGAVSAPGWAPGSIACSSSWLTRAVPTRSSEVRSAPAVPASSVAGISGS